MSFHVRFAPNTSGRDFVIGDLHGMIGALQQAMDAVNFDLSRDRCFSVGDLVDRGEDSVACAGLVEADWFHAVLGNHEDMLLRVVDDGDRRQMNLWRQNGGAWGIGWLRVNAQARAAAELFRPLPLVITLEHRSGWRIGICHAQCPVADWADIDTVEHDHYLRQEMLWGRSRIIADAPSPVSGIDLTIHGHTVIPSPLLSENALFIDTGAYLERPLTMLCLDEWIAERCGKDTAPTRR